jgi:hypothetical protein
MWLPKPRGRDRRDRHTMTPDYYTPIFAQNGLNSYNPRSYKCEAAPVDESLKNLHFSQNSHATARGYREGLFDYHDHDFYREQKEKGFPEDAYSNDFFQCTEENPRKWYEIGVAFHNQHAMIVLHDITGTNKDDPKQQFLYLGYEGRGPTGSDATIRKLHLVLTKEEDGHSYHDLLFHVPRKREELEQYFHVCRIRTTDRMVKYNAGLSFPRHYKVVASDCATFAHNFLIKTLSRVLADGHIEKAKYNEIVKNLVKHNKVTGGVVGETETALRRNRVLGESGGVRGALVES